jgi:SNF2 family DNA or RNA helicase
VAVLGLMAMRAGHTLTAANEAYMFELHPNPEVDMQAEARLHRIGQKEIVTVHYYLQLETTDPKIYQIVRDKVQATSHVLDGKQSDFAFASSSACKTEEKKSV